MEMSYAEQVVWRRRTYEIGIEPRLDRRLERVAREGNRLRVTFRNELTDEAEEHETGRIVVEHGTRPCDALFHGFADRSSNRGAVDQQALLAGAPQPEGERMMASGFSASGTRSPAATSTPRCSTRSACAARFSRRVRGLPRRARSVTATRGPLAGRA